MFYNSNNSIEQREYYSKMLKMMGSLSNLFSTNTAPYLDSRVSENLFCKCLQAENLSRNDITADAKKNGIGVGIKTWIGGNVQKIAEFDKKNKEYKKIDYEKFVVSIANMRNERIEFTMRSQNLKQMIYHCTKRLPGKIQILECSLDKIIVSKIKITNANNTSVSFSDGLNKYKYNYSKSTLYKDFSNLELLKEIDVEIINDPFELLEGLLVSKNDIGHYEHNIVQDRVYLPLYSYLKKTGIKKVEAKSGLNQRFASGRERNQYEVYIPIPAEFRKKYVDFFPNRDTPFDLVLPNGKTISAKVCQDGGKALMSNPNSELGKWLFDEVFQIKPNKALTFEIINKYGIDSVVIEKHWNIKDNYHYYTINFAKTDSYEKFIGRYYKSSNLDNIE